MRSTVVVFSLLITNAGFCGSQAVAKQAGQKDQGDHSAAIDQLAQQIFADADQNHNKVLNKFEFPNAQLMLEAKIAEWGREGIIGKPKKPGNKEKDSEHAPGSAAASANKLAKSNRVSQAEFTFYAHAVVAEADQQWRQMNATAAAQRKAMSAQRRYYPARGRRMVPYPYPY